MKPKRILWLTRHKVKQCHIDFLDRTFKLYEIVELTYSEYRFSEEHQKMVAHVDNLIKKYQIDIVLIIAPQWMKAYIANHTSHKEVIFMESVFDWKQHIWKRFRKIQC